MAKSFYTTGTGDEQTLTPIINEKVPIYDTIADAESDLANLEVGQIVKTKDAGLVANLNPIDEVKQGVFLPPTSNAVAKSLSYSTTEQKTGGKIVINGVEKDIYRKVIDTNAFTLGTIYATNVDRIVNQGGSIRESSGVWCAFPRSFSTTELQFRVDTSHNLIAQNANGGSFDYFSVWAEYTKNE